MFVFAGSYYFMLLVVLKSILFVCALVLMEKSYSGNVMSVSGNFVFHGVIQ